jgi:alanyl-tRNA synthetase
MKSSEIRHRFLEFFKNRGHEIILSASLVTSDEKGITNPTLFNTAGMQPLIPYLLGEPYLVNGKEVKRLADVQKCLRTIDIDDIGDKTHGTFFEMLGNWSLGDYFKKEAINWSFEFLTSKKEGLGLDPKRLYITVFEGDNNAPRDDEAADIWRDIFKKNQIEGERIFYMPAGMNWWEAGDSGPAGPDTEMYYDIGDTFNGQGITKDCFIEADSKREVVEVWNDVFMQYEKKDGKVVGKLPKPSVDTGAGLERLAMTMQGVDNIYDTDLLRPVMDQIKTLSLNWDLKSARIVTDHIKSAAFLAADGVVVSNAGRGYVMRRLIRRAVRCSDVLGMKQGSISEIVKSIINCYEHAYPDIAKKSSSIRDQLIVEETKFRETVNKGVNELKRRLRDQSGIRAKDVFDFYQSFGLNKDQMNEILNEMSLKYDQSEFDDLVKKHQALSRAGAEQKFKGGLADDSNPMVVRYHTATHLLHQALHDVLGDSVMQKGSNITAERLRFDFAHGAKMTDEEKMRVEDIVNKKIAAALPMNRIIMPRKEAEKTGARHFFGEKYGDKISIYFIGPASNPPAKSDLDKAYSKEFCGGPHVMNTKELAGPEGKWRFKIQKEEAVAQGVRRIRAVLQ